jgi:hypothetical protein
MRYFNQSSMIICVIRELFLSFKKKKKKKEEEEKKKKEKDINIFRCEIYRL